MKSLLAALVPQLALANMYDVVLPRYRSTCASGCLPWAQAALSPDLHLTQPAIDAMFINGSAGASAAGSSCAMPGAQAGSHLKDCGLHCYGDLWQFEYITSSYAGPWCFCKDPVANVTNTSQYCLPAASVPEQINLQYAAPGVVVVAFVTYEEGGAAPTEAPPQATLTPSNKSGAPQTVTGVSHLYTPPGRNVTGNSSASPVNPIDFDLPYNMHYVKFLVEPGQSYSYKVKGGAAAATWSDEYEFRAPADSHGEGAVTRIATYGDMGHSHYNNMQNLKDDAAAGLIDVVVHMGDHAYDLGNANDRRGDAYMNAWQPALTTLPWFPIIGNHEWVYKLGPTDEHNGTWGDGNGLGDGDRGRHYEVIAWGEAFGLGSDSSFPFPATPPYTDADSQQQAKAAPSTQQQQQQQKLHSTATSALGHHLAAGSLLGMGSHGASPSNTSRYTSADIGLIHMVALDLNLLDAAQLEWLTADLVQANANRKLVPWIVVMSHFPIFNSQLYENENMSAAHYRGDEARGDYETGELDNHMTFHQCVAAAVGQQESNGGSQSKHGKAAAAGCETVGEFQRSLSTALTPLFMQYGVDVYNAGHVHSYENTWPICGGFWTKPGTMEVAKVCTAPNGSSLQSFDQPRGTVHITEGNGGVPGVPGTFSAARCTKGRASACRVKGTGGAYGRITATPETLRYDRVANNGGKITDTWMITQSNHGPFPPPPPPLPVPPPPPGTCKRIVIHHTLGCFNYSAWAPAAGGGGGPVLSHYQPQVTGKLATLEGCAAACTKAAKTPSSPAPVAGMADGRYCFCGTEADLGSPSAHNLERPKAECKAVACVGTPAVEKGCGGVGRLLAYAFSCEQE